MTTQNFDPIERLLEVMDSHNFDVRIREAMFLGALLVTEASPAAAYRRFMEPEDLERAAEYSRRDYDDVGWDFDTAIHFIESWRGQSW